jgi:cell division protein FtsB
MNLEPKCPCPAQAASSGADENAQLVAKQSELDRALHDFRDGTLTAEQARQIIAQVASL